MADYWVSQERKYCDFCKCWIADNRPSVEFHEKGRRHQNNVKNRLKHITRNSNRQQKEAEKVDLSLKHMEKAAMDAYRNDIANNADLTSMAINKKIKAGDLEVKGAFKIWHEARSKDGKIYYTNTMTNETASEPPKEGYLSIAEQRELSYVKTKKELKEADKEKRLRGLLLAQHVKQEEEEERARLAREKLKERRVVDDLPPQLPAPLIESGNPSPYGKWETIKETPVIDFELPQQEELYYEAPVEYEPEPVVREFKEKTLESLGETSGEASFKKRKTNFGNKKNARQRLDND